MLRAVSREGERFAEPVADFHHSRNAPLICFVVSNDNQLRFVAFGRRGVSAGTHLRRLNLYRISHVSHGVQLDSYARFVPPRFRRPLRNRIEAGGAFTPKQFRALVDAMISQDGELSDLLRRYSTEHAQRIAALSKDVRTQLAFQKEAIGTALSLAGLDRGVLLEWQPPPPSAAPASFLSGIEQVRVREDLMVGNDSVAIPGFSYARSYIHGASVFENDRGTRLTVILANRQPLEELTGADLIYYNETFHSFVMVQYKAMDRDPNHLAIFRLPNAQLDEEIRRMDALVGTIEAEAGPVDTNGFRFDWNPFFLKLCPRIVFRPDDASLSPGMYIPLAKWKLLTASDHIIGKRGGRGITYDNVVRHLDNSSFLLLVANAWIGTTPGQSHVIEKAVRETIESGRAAVIAVRAGPPVGQQRSSGSSKDSGWSIDDLGMSDDDDDL